MTYPTVAPLVPSLTPTEDAAEVVRHNIDIEHDVDHTPTESDHLEPISLTTKVVNLIAIVLPFAGFLAAVILLWGRGFGWVYLGLLAAMYLVTVFGVTIGFHRFYTHRSFKTNRVVQAILGISGSMAVQGPVLRWVATHRCHHQHSDRPGDPHSPHDHEHGEGVIGTLKGLLHAHMGWLLMGLPKNLNRYIPDFNNDRLTHFISNTFVLWVAIGLLIPAVIGGLVTMSWTGALLGFLWGGLARVFLVHHVTWSINSVCHIWGSRPFKSHDHSRNNLLFGFLALGEGWHNNHHAFPASARHGLFWWQFDASYMIIRMMSWVGLVWDIKTPAPARMAAKMTKQA